MDIKTISITLNMESVSDNSLWKAWLNDSKLITEMLGYKSTHFGFTTLESITGKIKEIKNATKQIDKAIEEGQIIKHISIFALPPNFESASFDYDVMLVRSLEYITVIMNVQDYSEEIELKIINMLKKFTQKCDGEVFEMMKSEFPLSYSAKANKASFYKTLNIMKKIRVD